MSKSKFFLVFALFFYVGFFARGEEKTLPWKVFILAGQSNMEGQAVTDLEGKDYNGGRGTLKFLLRDPALSSKLKHLVDGTGNLARREDVWVRYQAENAPLRKGPLGSGYTPYGDTHHFGPELEFGHVVGDGLPNPVLLIKTAWGGKSLYKHFRPPSSGGQVGKYYTMMIDQVRETLNNLSKDFPAYKGEGYEIAGFVWYHGWNDGVDPKNAIPEYEQNLANLINDVRKDLGVPKLPVVVGEITGPWVDAPGEWNTLRKAQAAAANRPEFKNSVLFVETRNFVRKPEDSPNPGHGHHEFGNAETYFLVGEALGKGMLQAISGKSQNKPVRKDVPKEGQANLPTKRTIKNIQGWTIRVDDRLFEEPNKQLGIKCLSFLDNKLSDICVVVPPEKLKKLKAVTIVMDLDHGKLGSMQYHPGEQWLIDNGYAADLVKCVHIPRAADLPTKRNINEQPWVILHELAHAYHDQVLGFDHPRVREAQDRFKKSGHGDKALLFDGSRVKHYGLTNQMEFFAEMTEAYFGVNDFFPFNKAELREHEPEIYTLMADIWDAPKSSSSPKRR
jgi:hypothetical protein